ncbi:hypothetical protein EMIHUDRAFT_59557, partial [Emiliania huxleyi CCMP1516]|uniref:UV excision repair protein RAD23 n=2 Tax=Emiliania huxleyi TaxID=2903 RepID=A0A0D3JTX8_EMIH1
LVQSNPQMLQTVLMQIGQEQPELLAAINSNQQAFLEMMNQPIEEGSDAGPSSSGSSSAGGPPPRATTIRLTEDERAAVERLISLGGFDPNMVVQAYLACDKNEELAANWLFDN